VLFILPIFHVGVPAWFRLIDPAHPELAAGYEYAGETIPCEGSEDLCATKAVKDPASDEPDQDDVDAAKLASQNFTVPAANVAYEE
jgi:hypothetical protein